MNYIDGFVAAVPTAHRGAYLRHAQATGAVFKKYGALSVVERWGDDVPEGKLTSFPMAVQRKGSPGPRAAPATRARTKPWTTRSCTALKCRATASD